MEFLKITYKLTVLFLFILIGGSSFAQLDTIHWLPPLMPTQNNVNDQYLYLSTPSIDPFTVVIKDGGGNVLSTPIIANGAPFRYNVGQEMIVGINDLNNVINNKGLIIEGPVKFYANYRVKIPSQSGSLTGKGRSGKGQAFRIGFMPVPFNNNSRNNFFSIMATEDNTTITVSDYDPAVVFNGNPTLSTPTLNFVLNSGETYTGSCRYNVAANSNGLIGALVSSDKDVVVTTGNFLGALEPTGGGQDIGIDQIVPVDVIGSEYISIRGEGLASMEQVLVVAHEDDTKVYVNGNATEHSTLNAGEWVLVDDTYYLASGSGHRNMFIETSKPTYCFQFLGGSPSTATPGMNLLAPLSCKLPYAVNEMSDVDFIGTQAFTGGVFIVTRSGANVQIDGSATGVAGTVTGNPNWETYRVSGLTGDVTITSDQNLIAGIFGVNGAAGWAGYFSGFDTDPIKVALASVDSCGFVELTTDTTYITYNWFNNDVPYTGDSDTNEVFDSGDYKVIMTRPDGCKDSAFIDDIVVYNTPVADFTVSDECVNVPAEFVNNSTIVDDVISFNFWSFGDVLPITQVQSSDFEPEYEYFQAGTYDVRLIVETENGCRDTINKTTERYAVPVINFYADDQCIYDSVEFSNNSLISLPGVLSNIIWDYGDGSPVSNNFQENHKYTFPGVYTVSLSLESGDGCIVESNREIEIFDAPNSLFTSTIVCDNESGTSFYNNSTILNGSIMLTNWSFGDGANSNSVNPFHNYSSPGIYDAKLISVSDKGCIDSLELGIEVKASPNASFYLSKVEGCSPLCIDFLDQTIANSPSLTSQEWFFNEERLFVGNSFSNCFENDSNEEDISFDMKYIVTNDIGCEDTLEINNYITVYHNPKSIFELEPPITNMYEREVETINNSIGAHDYLWFFNSTNAVNEFEASYEYPDTGYYDVLLIAFTENSCVDSSYQTFLVEPVENVYVPNAFTPNNDGANDVFNISTFGIKEEDFLLRIFNRWGEKIYETNKLYEGWNGFEKGIECKSDVYVYRVNYKNLDEEEKELIGSVTLIR